jgi:hypothetical protein
MSTSGQLVGISGITAVRQFRLGVDRTLGCTVYDFVAVRASKTPQINGFIEARAKPFCGRFARALPTLVYFPEADFLPGMTSALPMKLPNPGFWSR